MGEMDANGSPLPSPGDLGGRPQEGGRQVFLEAGQQVVSADALVLRDEGALILNLLLTLTLVLWGGGALSGPAIEESIISLFREHDTDNDGYIDDDAIAKLLPQLYLTRGAGPLHRDWKFTLVSLVQSSIKHFQDPKRKGEVALGLGLGLGLGSGLELGLGLGLGGSEAARGGAVTRRAQPSHPNPDPTAISS